MGFAKSFMLGFLILAFTNRIEARDVTFFVVGDTHADPGPSDDLKALAKAINSVGKGGVWPSRIGASTTDFIGGAIAEPRGVVIVGDITGWGTAPAEIQTFRRYFEKGFSPDSINYSAYVGLGNHDVDPADRPEALAKQYREAYWAYIDSRHKGANAPVPVKSFDSASHSYSWDFDGVHLLQAHRFPGDTGFGLPSNLGFIENDLAAQVGAGRPAILFHHYGMDSFGSQDRWWTSANRDVYRNVLGDKNIAAIFAGHSHFAMQYDWEGEKVFQVNNAKAEVDSGNNDGNGSFAIVRVSDDRINIVTCRWTNESGAYELIAPFYSGSIR